jgi:hypothetical protein
MKTFLQILALAIFLPTASAAEIKGATIEERNTEKKAQETYVEQLKKLIDEITASGKDATDKGKQMTAGAKSWLKDDFKKIGDWEYKQLTIPLTEIAAMEKNLNELGTDRWDCFWIQQHKDSIHLLFKRPSVSYLHKLSTVDFMKLISVGTGGGDAE